MAVQPYIIGLTGGSASGKSSFARSLKALYTDEQLMVLCEDNYYLPKEKVPVDNNGMQNFDVPESIDYPLFIEHVRSLRDGIAIQKQEYTFYKPGWEPKILTIAPTPIIVLEGLFSLHFEEVRNMVDLKLYIDADPAARFNRRVKRDLEERGLDRSDAEYRWTNHIMPCYEQTHNEYKACADIIILNNTSFEPGLHMLKAFLDRLLATG